MLCGSLEVDVGRDGDVLRFFAFRFAFVFASTFFLFSFFSIVVTVDGWFRLPVVLSRARSLLNPKRYRWRPNAVDQNE